MKKQTFITLSILLCILIFGCKSQPQFVKVIPENDMFEFESEQGTLFEPEQGTIQLYFLLLNKNSDSVKFKQDFLVVKLKRHSGDTDNLAYKLLDSLNEVRRCQHADTGKYSNWSVEDKAHIKNMIENEMRIRCNFYDNVKVYVEKEAINSGISSEAYLKYEPDAPYVDTTNYARIWKASDFNIYPNGKRYDLQPLIDSAYKLLGVTKLVFDTGFYKFKGIYFDYTKERTSEWISLDFSTGSGFEFSNETPNKLDSIQFKNQ